MAGRYILKNDRKRDNKPFVRKIEVSSTGFDITYSQESTALQFATRSVAVIMRQSLAKYGDFYPVEVD